jgi:hypothetical protein
MTPIASAADDPTGAPDAAAGGWPIVTRPGGSGG